MMSRNLKQYLRKKKTFTFVLKNQLEAKFQLFHLYKFCIESLSSSQNANNNYLMKLAELHVIKGPSEEELNAEHDM